jgi:hypothetical protein
MYVTVDADIGFPFFAEYHHHATQFGHMMVSVDDFVHVVQYSNAFACINDKICILFEVF